MSEQDNDRLEQFFRKATSKPEVSFNEEDWKKLEARLDTMDDVIAGQTGTSSRLATITAVVLILLFTGALWVNYLYDFIPVRQQETAVEQPGELEHLNKNNDQAAAPDAMTLRSHAPEQEEQIQQWVDPAPGSPNNLSGPVKPSVNQHVDLGQDVTSGFGRQPGAGRELSDAREDGNAARGRNTSGPGNDVATPLRNGDETNRVAVARLQDEKIFNDLVNLPSGIIERNKQKATDELPGAEEASAVEAESVMGEEQVSDHNNHRNSPRLSLLLSIAPDFSTTSTNRYSAPGKAFGAMLNYHLTPRWSVSAGIIKNNKQYTGDGEDYKPPYGYWKYYTNGKVPNTIYGACTVLEFPLMVRYTIRQGARNRLSAGIGASSYLMLDESYDYVFDEPNPGAKHGWSSDENSRFLFNMANVTIAYEHQVLPGFMIGIEPYVKIPMEEIGWTNLKLFSTGASLTMRYVIFTKTKTSMATRSRGPD